MLSTFQTFKSFLDMCLSRDPTQDNIDTCYLEVDEIDTDAGSSVSAKFPIYVFNDRPPQYWSTYNDQVIVFDAYDKAVDTTLQGSKTMCWGYKLQDLLLEDESVPYIPKQLQSLLIAKAKDKAFDVIKQYRSPTVAREARKQEVKAQTYKSRTDKLDQLQVQFPDFGRK